MDRTTGCGVTDTTSLGQCSARNVGCLSNDWGMTGLHPAGALAVLLRVPARVKSLPFCTGDPASLRPAGMRELIIVQVVPRRVRTATPGASLAFPHFA